MEISEIEAIVINCILTNLRNSNESAPSVTPSTAPLSDIAGFDSLRVLEVLIDIEEVLGCDLPPEKVFAGPNPTDTNIASIAEAIKKVKEDSL